MDDITVSFPGGKAVDARWGTYHVHTDQPVAAGGDDSAPSPYELFLASIATCAGYYVLGFCLARQLPTDGISLVQSIDADPVSKLPCRIRLALTLPIGFPDKYRAAVVRAAEGCKVKKAIASAPAIEVELVAREHAA